MKRKTTRLFITVLAFLMTTSAGLPVSAVTQSDKEDVNRKIEKTQIDLKNGKEKQNQLIQQVQEVNKEMAVCQEEIRDMESRIREKQAEFRKKGVELTSAQAYEKLKGV